MCPPANHRARFGPIVLLSKQREIQSMYWAGGQSGVEAHKCRLLSINYRQIEILASPVVRSFSVWIANVHDSMLEHYELNH